MSNSSCWACLSPATTVICRCLAPEYPGRRRSRAPHKGDADCMYGNQMNLPCCHKKKLHYVILTQKIDLEKYGLRGSSLDIFRSYLSQHNQAVIVDGKLSALQSTDCSVPQVAFSDCFFLMFILMI